MPNVYDAKRMTLAFPYAKNATATDSTILRKTLNAEVRPCILVISFKVSSRSNWKRSDLLGAKFSLKEIFHYLKTNLIFLKKLVNSDWILLEL